MAYMSFTRLDIPHFHILIHKYSMDLELQYQQVDLWFKVYPLIRGETTIRRAEDIQNEFFYLFWAC